MSFKPSARPAAPAAANIAPVAESSTLSNTTLALIVGGAVVAVGAAAYFLLSGKKDASEASDRATETVEEAESEEDVPVKKNDVPRAQSNNGKPVSGGAGRQADADEDSDADVPALEERSTLISKSELLNMLAEMFAKISELQAQLKALHDSGELSPEDIIESHSEGIGNIEKELHKKYNVCQADLTKAYEAYDGDDEVNEALERLQKLFTVGDADVEAPEGLTIEEFLEKFNLQNRIMMGAVDEIVSEVKLSGKSGLEAIQTFQQQLMSRLSKLEEETSSQIGLSQKEFMGAFMKFGNDPRVMHAAETVQRFTQQRQMEIMSL